MKFLEKMILVIIISLLVLPLSVNADSYPVGSSIYSEQATISSNVNFIMSGYIIDEKKNSNLNGTLTYDSEILEFVELKEIHADFIEGQLPPEGKITMISNKKGKIEYSYINEEFSIGSRVQILAIFKVKSKPINGQTEIIFKSKDEVEVISQIEIISDESSQAKCDSDVELQDNVLTYISWGLSGILLISLFIVLLKRN